MISLCACENKWFFFCLLQFVIVCLCMPMYNYMCMWAKIYFIRNKIVWILFLLRFSNFRWRRRRPLHSFSDAFLRISNFSYVGSTHTIARLSSLWLPIDVYARSFIFERQKKIEFVRVCVVAHSFGRWIGPMCEKIVNAKRNSSERLFLIISYE